MTTITTTTDYRPSSTETARALTWNREETSDGLLYWAAEAPQWAIEEHRDRLTGENRGWYVTRALGTHDGAEVLPVGYAPTVVAAMKLVARRLAGG